MVENIDCTPLQDKPLKLNSTGEQVSQLQRLLKEAGYYLKAGNKTLKVDGKYGTYTEAAVIELQKKTNHDPDGVFGHKTCPDLNRLVNEKHGIKTTTTPTPQSTTTKTTTTSTTKAYVNPYVIDTSKNVYTAAFSTLHIQGLHFVCNSLKRGQELPVPEWKTVELMDGGDFDYLSSRKPLQYTCECILGQDEYNQMRSEIIKLAYQPCKVSSWMFPYGTYTVKVSVDQNSIHEVKVTFDLKEYRG